MLSTMESRMQSSKPLLRLLRLEISQSEKAANLFYKKRNKSKRAENYWNSEKINKYMENLGFKPELHVCVFLNDYTVPCTSTFYN